MSAKHTAGPWRAAKGGGGTMSILRVQGDELVAYIPHGWPKAQREANARLIAASPDLLEALKEIEDTLAFFALEYVHGIVRAAIAKAEGEQP